MSYIFTKKFRFFTLGEVINKKSLEIEDIKKIVPHRYPFLLIDRVLDFEVGKMAYGIKNVSINEWFFAGHFPNEPIMPGVLIIEALAQLSNVAMFANKAFEDQAKDFAGYFVKIDGVTFRKKVIPGDVLHLYTENVRNIGRMSFFGVCAKVDNEIAAQGKIIATMR